MTEIYKVKYVGHIRRVVYVVFILSRCVQFDSFTRGIRYGGGKWISVKRYLAIEHTEIFGKASREDAVWDVHVVRNLISGIAWMKSPCDSHHHTSS